MTTPNFVVNPIMQFFDKQGKPLAGGYVYFYTTGTTNLATIYSNASLTTPLPNPNILTSSGYISTNGTTPSGVYWKTNTVGKITVAYSIDTNPPQCPLWDIDPIYGLDSADFENYFTRTSSTTITLNNGITFQTGPVRLPAILDTNGNTIVLFTPSGMAVNYINITDAAHSSNPIIASAGTDSIINLDLQQKGAKPIVLGTTGNTGIQFFTDQPILDSSGNKYINLTKTASSVNAVTVTNAATTVSPSIIASGSNTTIPLTVDSKRAFSTTVAAGSATIGSSNVTTVTVASTTGMANGNTLVLQLDNGVMFSATITGIVGSVVSLSAATTNTAQIGNLIYAVNVLNLGPTNAHTVNVGTVSAAANNLGSSGISTVTIGSSTATTTLNQTVIPNTIGSVGEHVRIGTTPGTLKYTFAAHKESVVTFTTSGTWVVPNDVNEALFELWGAGGGGGGCSTGSAGSGGGGGAYCKKLAAVTPGSTVTITVSSTGGAGGAAGVNSGTAGGNTTCTGGGLIATLTANGGAGGLTGFGSAGAAGGTASNGDVNINGGNSATNNSSAEILLNFGGDAANGGYGGTILAPASAGGGAGGPGTFPGGAGGGSQNIAGTTANAGGNGAGGFVIITY